MVSNNNIATNESTVANDSQPDWCEIDNSLDAVSTKVAELANEVASLKEKMAKMKAIPSEPSTKSKSAYDSAYSLAVKQLLLRSLYED